jgi:glutamate racemase
MLKRAIGVFDSGFGGLTILKEIRAILPSYDYIYFGDSARAPYGSKSQEQIYEFTKNAVDFLFKNGCELIVLACNTASSEALRKLQREYLPLHYPNRRILGVIIPACEVASQVTTKKKVAVIGTEATISSNVFTAEMLKLDANIELIQVACPLLVPLIEEGEVDSDLIQNVLAKYLNRIDFSSVDTLILGCTHYGLIANIIRKLIGKEVEIICESKIVPRKLENYLARHTEINKMLTKNAYVVYYTTDSVDKFSRIGSVFLAESIMAEKANLF